MPDTLNDIAQQRFEKLRTKLMLDVQKPILQHGITLTQETIDELSDVCSAKSIINSACDAAIKNTNEIDKTFDYINSLQLPPQLSLAIGLIISGHKTKNSQDLIKAIESISEVLNGET